MKKWLLSAALCVTASTAFSQNCVPHLPAAQGLAEKCREGVVARGLQANGLMLELYLNAETGTFTILTVTPQGLACLVSAGEAMSLIDIAPAGEPS